MTHQVILSPLELRCYVMGAVVFPGPEMSMFAPKRGTTLKSRIKALWTVGEGRGPWMEKPRF